MPLKSQEGCTCTCTVATLSYNHPYSYISRLGNYTYVYMYVALLFVAECLSMRHWIAHESWLEFLCMYICMYVCTSHIGMQLFSYRYTICMRISFKSVTSLTISLPHAWYMSTSVMQRWQVVLEQLLLLKGAAGQLADAQKIAKWLQ